MRRWKQAMYLLMAASLTLIFSGCDSGEGVISDGQESTDDGGPTVLFTATFQEENQSSTSGTATISLDEQDQEILKLNEDFKTSNRCSSALQLYLSADSIDNAQQILGASKVGTLSGLSGPQSFNLSVSTASGAFDYIVLFCPQLSLVFGQAKLESAN